MHYDHQVQVRYGETDQMGVVHHANYLLYFEEARTAFLAHHGQPYGQLEKDGLALPVRKLDLRFRAPAQYEDVLRVRVAVDRITAASVRFLYEIWRPADQTLLVTGSTELACIDLRTTPRKPHVLPQAMRDLFA
ncbi:MAG: acyl-CoA thioesterase [Planctomycetes bacterium]|nr:acyl-CoA thioesterase [Planctomycetota bacterium]